MPLTQNLNGRYVLSFESRRSKEMEALIQKHGGRAKVVPSLREVPLEENQEALSLGDRLARGEVDLLILLTGVGTRTLVQALQTRFSLDQIKSWFQKTTLLVRGPKPIAALAEIGLKPQFAAPEPNTWREILQLLDEKFPVQSKRVAVQEYGISNQELIEAIQKRGAEVTPVPVYRWALPKNVEPLKEAIREVSEGKFEVTLWTNAQQVVHAFQVAKEMGKEEAFRKGLNQTIAASIGPTCSEMLRQKGVRVDFEPSHPKMGILVAELNVFLSGRPSQRN